MHLQLDPTSSANTIIFNTTAAIANSTRINITSGLPETLLHQIAYLNSDNFNNNHISQYTNQSWNAILGFLNYALAVALILVCIFVILGNSLVVTAIWHENQLHSVTNYLIASLAAADCFVGVLVMPFCILTEIIYDSWPFGEQFCHIWHSFDVLASTASIMNLCAISLDRYLAITDPISYPRRMTFKRVGILIVCLWTCSALISFPAILWWKRDPRGPLVEIPRESDHIDDNEPIRYRCVFTEDKYYLLFSSTISFYGPLCVMLYAYIKIYRAAVKQTKFLNFGSKQVVVGGKKRKRTRFLSRYLHCNFSDNSKNARSSADETNDFNGQHLVLRVHRGGACAPTKIKSNNINCDNNNNIYSDHHWNKSQSVKSKQSFEQSDDLKADVRSRISEAGSEHNVIRTHHLQDDKIGSSKDSIKRNLSFAKKNEQFDIKTERKEKLRVTSQRFDAQIESPTESQSPRPCDLVEFQTKQKEDDLRFSNKIHADTSDLSKNNKDQTKSKNIIQKYDSKNGKQLLASINDKSSMIDSKVLAYEKSHSPTNDSLIDALISESDASQSNVKTSTDKDRELPAISLLDLNNEERVVLITGNVINQDISNGCNYETCDEGQESLHSSSTDDTFESSIVSVLMRPIANNDQILYSSCQQSMNSQNLNEADDCTKKHNQNSPTNTHYSHPRTGTMTSSISIQINPKKNSRNVGLNNHIDEIGANDSSNKGQKKGSRKKMSKLAKERKAAKTLGIVVGVFILCWLPFFVINIVVAVCGSHCIKQSATTMSIVTWLGWLNSAMNPVIYACWSREFRRAFSRTLGTWIGFLCPYSGSTLVEKFKKSQYYCQDQSFTGRTGVSTTMTATTIKSNVSSSGCRTLVSTSDTA